MALSVSHPVSTRDTNIIHRALAQGLIWDVIWKEPYHIMFIIYLTWESLVLYYELWRRRSHMINIILRGMIKGWWYRYQSRRTNTVVMFFQYYICKFPLFSTKYMINVYIRQITTRHVYVFALGVVVASIWYRALIITYPFDITLKQSIAKIFDDTTVFVSCKT